ncbi:MAG: glycosyltransferase family 4 protein [Planctomycetota bacterium]|nr:glycosyltransferase family 4 protein [Planctomycetota bacterium]
MSTISKIAEPSLRSAPSAPHSDPLRILFVKHGFAWPRSSGHDVHGFHMMQSLAQQGHEIFLATTVDPPAEALAGLNLRAQVLLDDPSLISKIGQPANSARLTKWQEKFRSYWGVPSSRVSAVGELARKYSVDAVVAIGLDILPYLGEVENAQRIWYAADEWVWHHLSQFKLLQKNSWCNVRQAAVKGLYERAFRNILDDVWVVTDADSRAMRWLAGMRSATVIANGVDTEHFRPVDVETMPRSCAFWGRLDFGPNQQALDWFCRRVWPAVRQRVPDAQFFIYGFNPDQATRALATATGITLTPDLTDLRAAVSRHPVVVLPFVSGGGIKNKALEAASLSRAIVGSRRACLGLKNQESLPIIQASSVPQWVDTLESLWDDPIACQERGRRSRQWVAQDHSWQAAAELAATGIRRRLESVRR